MSIILFIVCLLFKHHVNSFISTQLGYSCHKRSYLTALLDNPQKNSHGDPKPNSIINKHEVTPLNIDQSNEIVEIDRGRIASVILSPLEVLFPPSADISAVISIFVGQSLMLLTVLLLQLFTNFNAITHGFFLLDKNSVTLSFIFLAPLILGAYFFEKLPWTQDWPKQVIAGTKIFTLRILGRTTPILVAGLQAAILAICSGLSEEIFFRGMVYNLIENVSNVPTAILGSSFIFGLAHFPFALGATVVLQSILGVCFAFSYWLSNYNLTVPILLHAGFDFVVVFGSWLSASAELKKNLIIRNDLLKEMPKQEDTHTFQEFCKAVFDMVDVNNDGVIDKSELILARRLVIVGPSLYGISLDDTEFEKYDKNDDGKIDFEEFQDLLAAEIEKFPERKLASPYDITSTIY